MSIFFLEEGPEIDGGDASDPWESLTREKYPKG
jgi:hypothetical protein